jgi:hypothetical protein
MFGRNCRGLPDRVLEYDDVALARLCPGRLARESEERCRKRRKGEDNGDLPAVHGPPLLEVVPTGRANSKPLSSRPRKYFQASSISSPKRGMRSITVWLNSAT